MVTKALDPGLRRGDDFYVIPAKAGIQGVTGQALDPRRLSRTRSWIRRGDDFYVIPAKAGIQGVTGQALDPAVVFTGATRRDDDLLRVHH